jgi:hypothetical protein
MGFPIFRDREYKEILKKLDIFGSVGFKDLLYIFKEFFFSFLLKNKLYTPYVK